MPAVGAVAAGAPLPLATPTPSYPQVHQWLARPVNHAIANNKPDRFYPYGSTGQGRYQVHHGVEFVNPTGTPVQAVADGTVVVAGSDEQQTWGRHLGYYGLLVVVRLEYAYGNEPIYALYGHLSRVQVRLGQRVRWGQVIGLVGSSGVALGSHLHFEVRIGQNAFSHTRNPELWIEPLPGHGTIIGRIESERRPVPEALITFHPVDRPNRYWRETWTYPNVRREQIHPDDLGRENFVIGDVPVGEYIVRTRVHGRLYTRRVHVAEGQVTLVSIAAPPTRHPEGRWQLER